jgi:sulfane dehydrogenase subunit SoxC
MHDEDPRVEPEAEGTNGPPQRLPGDAAISRRALFQLGGAVGGAAAVAAVVPSGFGAVSAQSDTATPAATPAADGSALPPDIPPWMQAWGPLPSEYGERSPFESGVVRLPSATSSRTPLQDLHGTMTPNSLFFERHHAGIPEIDPALHRLIVHGMVERPIIYTMDDIKRFPATSVIHFHECSGNSGSEWREESIAPTAQAGFGLVSQTEWTGVPLTTILAEAGVDPNATWLLAEGADAAGMTRSIPIEKAMDDALVAYAMNGEALRPSAGYPVRLVLPGYEGNANIKWLRRIEAGDAPWMTREETSKYTDLMPDGTARQFTFVMEAKSVITTPSGGQTVAAPGFWEISGIAWSGRGRITGVDVSTDGGATWAAATLQEPVLSKALTRFRFPWTWDGKPARLQSRAVDETGYVQPTIPQLVEIRGTNSTYHMNGIKTWAVAESGEVTSAFA